MLYGMGNEEANRYTGALTGEASIANQRNMQNAQNARDERLAGYTALGSGVQSGVQAYYGSGS
jgi:hypothetical protein